MPNVGRNISRNKNMAGKTVDDIVRLLNKYADEFGINTVMRWRHYLAQVAHESCEFLYTEEIASGKAYDTGRLAKMLGNTPAADGDGQKYKGRGLIQLTGRSNYEAYRRYCGFDVVSDPTLLARPVGAVRSSMWFWKTKGLNALADKNDFLSITKKINGGTNGLSERKRYLNRAEAAIK